MVIIKTSLGLINMDVEFAENFARVLRKQAKKARPK